MPYYNVQNHYLMRYEDHKALRGPMSSGAVIDLINAMPHEEAVKHHNASRYEMAKEGWYPNTKAGALRLMSDIKEATHVTE